MKSCDSEDSGVGKENNSISHDEKEACRDTVDDEDDDDEEVGGSALQFAKCRAGIQLFREVSVKSLPPQPSVPNKGCQQDLSQITDLLTVMASMRMDDQRCDLSAATRNIGTKPRKSPILNASVSSQSPQKTSTVSRKTCRETLMEMLDKNIPLPQILLLSDSQWIIHRSTSEEGSREVVDMFSRTVTTSSTK